jgi:hypothetical protein
MRTLFLIFLFGCLTTGLCMAEKQKDKSSEPLETYELYSWRDDTGGWNFSILGTTSRLRTPEEIFSEKETIHGVDKLKQKISHLVRPSRIVWTENLAYKGVPIKGTERLAWPPKEIIEDVKHYAAARRVEVIGTK